VVRHENFLGRHSVRGEIFVADPAQGSRHNRGCAVDLTLYDLATGKPIEMPGTYDEMSPRSFPNYPGGTSLQRWHRDLLRRAMESEGFAVYEASGGILTTRTGGISDLECALRKA